MPMPKPKRRKMHTTKGVPKIPRNIHWLINSAKSTLAMARLEQNKEKAAKLRSTAFEKINGARDALKDIKKTRHQTLETRRADKLIRQANEIFEAENTFFKKFGRHATGPIELYSGLKLSRQQVIELEKARLAQNKQAGDFLPDWRIKQIIDRTLEQLGIG